MIDRLAEERRDDDVEKRGDGDGRGQRRSADPQILGDGLDEDGEGEVLHDPGIEREAEDRRDDHPPFTAKNARPQHRPSPPGFCDASILSCRSVRRNPLSRPANAGERMDGALARGPN
jgi:hypothetical protein